MHLSKEILLHTLREKNIDKAVKVFYEAFGTSVRSEYRLDDEDVVDLDWESSGLIVTIVNSKVEQLRLTVHSQEGNNFDGWIGDDVKPQSSLETLQKQLEFSDTYGVKYHDFRLGFEFDDNALLGYVIIRNP
jgi:hypothetical protein